MGSRQRRERREAREVQLDTEFRDDFADTPEQLARNRRINRLLPEHFPELRDVYKREVSDPEGWDEDIGPHVFYADVFYPFLERALLGEPDGSPLLDRIYAFLKLLDEHDAEYGYLATVGVGEFLAYTANSKALRRAQPQLGPNMRAFLDRV